MRVLIRLVVWHAVLVRMCVRVVLFLFSAAVMQKLTLMFAWAAACAEKLARQVALLLSNGR